MLSKTLEIQNKCKPKRLESVHTNLIRVRLGVVQTDVFEGAKKSNQNKNFTVSKS